MRRQGDLLAEDQESVTQPDKGPPHLFDTRRSPFDRPRTKPVVPVLALR